MIHSLYIWAYEFICPLDLLPEPLNMIPKGLGKIGYKGFSCEMLTQNGHLSRGCKFTIHTSMVSGGGPVLLNYDLDLMTLMTLNHVTLTFDHVF